MIEVIVDQTGDRAEAPDAESAVVAARTMCDDHLSAGLVIQGAEQLTVTFLVGGVPLAGFHRLPVRELWALGPIS